MDRASEALHRRAAARRRGPTTASSARRAPTAPGTSGVRWVVDPLDGTTNYLYGLPGFNVSIAAEVDGAGRRRRGVRRRPRRAVHAPSAAAARPATARRSAPSAATDLGHAPWSAPASPTTPERRRRQAAGARRGAPPRPRHPPPGRRRRRPVLGRVRPPRRLLRAGPGRAGTWPPAGSSPPRPAPSSPTSTAAAPRAGSVVAAAPGIADALRDLLVTHRRRRRLTPPAMAAICRQSGGAADVTGSQPRTAPDRRSRPARCTAHDARRRPTSAGDRAHRRCGRGPRALRPPRCQHRRGPRRRPPRPPSVTDARAGRHRPPRPAVLDPGRRHRPGALPGDLQRPADGLHYRTGRGPGRDALLAAYT